MECCDSNDLPQTPALNVGAKRRNNLSSSSVLLYRLFVILETVNCNRVIDNVAFGSYCSETAELFVRHYHWYLVMVMLIY